MGLATLTHKQNQDKEQCSSLEENIRTDMREYRYDYLTALDNQNTYRKGTMYSMTQIQSWVAIIANFQPCRNTSPVTLDIPLLKEYTPINQGMISTV